MAWVSMGEKTRSIILSLRSGKMSLCSSGICEWGLGDVQVIHQCLQPFSACGICLSGVFEMILSRCKLGVNVLLLPHYIRMAQSDHRQKFIISQRKQPLKSVESCCVKQNRGKAFSSWFNKRVKTNWSLGEFLSVCSDPRGLWEATS